ncbi:TATA element modulatory factor 1 TATA binding-domain-containing protein [Obelidium mucronatum]|nr:TATA element modulatory factor 1 TATA binding-domain-containing protein [Obelidium mucronatum]
MNQVGKKKTSEKRFNPYMLDFKPLILDTKICLLKLEVQTDHLFVKLNHFKFNMPAARKDWEQIEVSLTARLQQAERECFESGEKEKASVEKCEELNKKVSSLEYQFGRERQERSRIQAELDDHVSRLDNSDRQVSDLTAKLNHLKTSHARELQEAQTAFQETLRKALEEERRKTEMLLKEERDRLQRERLKVDDLKQLSEKVNSTNGAAGPTSSATPPFVSTSSLPKQSSGSLDGVMSPSGYDSPRTPLDISSGGVAGQHQPGGAVVERLYHSLKQLQGQVSSLQAQLHMVTKTRDELAEELVKATSDASDAKTSAATIQSLESQLGELNRRYMAALELLGEKMEKVEDLQQNIDELKRIQKIEIEELMRVQKPAS